MGITEVDLLQVLARFREIGLKNLQHVCKVAYLFQHDIFFPNTFLTITITVQVVCKIRSIYLS